MHAVSSVSRGVRRSPSRARWGAWSQRDGEELPLPPLTRCREVAKPRLGLPLMSQAARHRGGGGV